MIYINKRTGSGGRTDVVTLCCKLPPLAPPAYSRVTQLLSTAPTATRGDEDAVQNNHAFDNGAKGREAIHAGQSLSSLFVGSAAEAVAAGKAIW